MSKEINVHHNLPQIRSWAIMAHEETAIWSRGTGKSEGLVAPRMLHNFEVMPRGTGVLLGATYAQLLTRTLPPVIAEWERLGYRRDIHFFIGRTPPRSWTNWIYPIRPPLDPKYFIYWFNGSGCHLVSQDRPGSANGISIDWIIADEAKFIKKQRLDEELLPANRGHREKFGHRPEHHGILYCSDMPTNSTGSWLLEKEDDVDKVQIDLMIDTQIRIHETKQELNKTKSTSKQTKLTKRLNRYNKQLMTLRMDSVYFSEASAFDNIDALGEKYIKQMKRVLPNIVFRTAICNERVKKIENGFYGFLDEDKHYYDAFDNSQLDQANYNFDKLQTLDCRYDNDLLAAQPLEIAFDYGGIFNCAVVGQESMNIWRSINAFYVKHPYLTKDVANKICEYYRFHRCKTIEYWYDSTAVGKTGLDELTYKDQVIKVFRNNGWTVRTHYTGQPPSHWRKYEMLAAMLRGDSQFPAYRINRQNCWHLILSKEQAGIKQGKHGYEKDKSPEHNEEAKQEEATHFSDAEDMILWGKYKDRMVELGEFTDIMTT